MPRGTLQREERLHANALSLMSQWAAIAAGGSLGLTQEEALTLARRLADNRVSVTDYLEETRVKREREKLLHDNTQSVISPDQRYRALANHFFNNIIKYREFNPRYFEPGKLPALRGYSINSLFIELLENEDVVRSFLSDMGREKR